MCVLSIKLPIRKKSGNFFNDPCISTIIGYLIPNPLYIYIEYAWFGSIGSYDISTIISYFMSNTFITNILTIYDLVWLGFMAYQPL